MFQAFLQPAGVFPLLGCNLGPLDDSVGDATHGSTVHAEGALGNAILELVQEGYLAVLVVHVDLHAPSSDLRVVLEFCGERVVVCSEEAYAANVRCDMVEDGLCNRNAIV